MARELRDNGLVDEAKKLLKCNSVLLARGRWPSRGCVTMLKSEYDAIANPHACIHALVVDAEVTLTVPRLCITHVEAIIPGFRTGSTPNVPVIDSTWCLVEFADARHYAGEFSALDVQYNLRETTGEAYFTTGTGEGRFTYKGLCTDIWKRLSGLFGDDLTFQVKDSTPDLSPENMKFLGISAWDALWVVLDLAGWTFFMDGGEPTIVQLGDPVDDPEFRRLTDTAVSATLMDAGNIQPSFLPSSIKVTTTLRDYQFEVEAEGTFTAGDNYRRFPTASETFQTRTLIDPIDEIVTNTTVQLWSALQLFTNDLGASTNADLVRAHSKDIARRYLTNRQESKSTEFEWIGLPSRQGTGTTFRPSKLFSGVFIRSHGTLRTLGVNSVISEPRWVDGHIEWELSWKAEEARPGALTQDAVPHGRELYAVLRARVGGSPGEEGEDSCEGRVVNHVQPDRFGIVQILKGVVVGSGVAWSGVGFVTAVNATGGPIRLNRRVFCKWNYQLATGGLWCIVSVHGSPEGDDLADWEALCISDGIPVKRSDDPGLIILNRRSMLRLIRPRTEEDEEQSQGEEGEEPNTSDQDDQKKDPCVVAIVQDIQHGPPGTLLWTGTGDNVGGEQENETKTIYWTDGPTVKTIRLSSGILNLGTGPRASQLLTPSSGRGIKFRLPPPPNRSDAYLVSKGTAGACTETDWFGPGANCTIRAATECFDPGQFFTDYFCQMVDNCNEFGSPWGSSADPLELLGSPTGTDCAVREYEFQKGLLVAGGGCSQPSGSSGGASCPDISIRHWNPCRDVPDDPVSPGEEDGGPIPDEPTVPPDGDADEPTVGVDPGTGPIPFEPLGPNPADELPPLLGDPTRRISFRRSS